MFGAPPDCATNKYCAIGLKNVYGITFKQIKTTDFGGPITVHALKAGTIQIGELFSTSVYDSTFVVLEALRPGRGKQLHYDQYVHPRGYESVSFASMAFDR